MKFPIGLLALSSSSTFNLVASFSPNANVHQRCREFSKHPLRIELNDKPSSSISLLQNRQFQTFLQSSVLLEQPEAVATSSSSSEGEEGDEDIRSVGVEESEPQSISFLDDGFVFGLEGSGLSRQKGKVAQVVVEGDTLETQPYQLVLVSATLITHAVIASLSVVDITTVEWNHGHSLLGLVESIAIVFSSWVMADLGSGVLHWSVDNYGNGRTPVMGGIIAAFQGHHTAPWTITEREFCNNVHKLCIPFGIPTIVFISALSGPAVKLFFAMFCVNEIMSQEFHKWSHQKAREVPDWGNYLMDKGVTISRKDHNLHHAAPFKDNYCIVSGFCNDFLDGSGIFRWLEHQVYKINGVESNAWKIDPDLKDRTLRGVYAPPK